MIISIANKTLFLVLTLCILANLGVMVWQTHLFVQVTFGNPPVEQVALAPALDMALMQPLPTHPAPQKKPKIKG